VNLTWLDLSIGDDQFQSSLFATEWNGSAFVAQLPGDVVGTGVGAMPSLVSNYELVADPAGHPFIAFFDGDVAHPGIFVRGNTFVPNRIFLADDTTTVQSIIDTQTLGAGDVVYLAPGTVAGDITVGASDSGFLLTGASTAQITGTLKLMGVNGVTIQGLHVASEPVFLGNVQNVSVIGSDL
jgi:hypothetical protein